MNPNNQKQRERLFRAIHKSYRTLEPFRKLVRGLVEEYAGSGYGPGTSRNRYATYVNLTNQAIDAYTMSLAANRPRVLVTTDRQDLKHFARHYQLAVNNLIREINLEYTLRQAVLDAFFCLGIVKVHMAESVEVQVEDGTWMDLGIPFASNISLDNWVHDTSATEYHRVKFAGDGYRIPFDQLKSDVFDQKVARKLTPSSKRLAEDSERIEQISTGREVDEDEYEPMIDLMDIWIPKEGRIFTFAMNGRFDGKEAPVADMPWDGSEFGPYHLLSFNDVPENIMPASPASQTAELNRLANSLMRKQAWRAENQKDVYTYTSAGAQDAKKVQGARDQQWVMVNDPKEIGVVKSEGVDATGVAFLEGVIDYHDRMAGNLSARAGLGPQADTVGQEELIHSRLTTKEAQMQYRALDFSTRIVRDLGHLLWNDKAKMIEGRIPIEGAADFSVDATWRPGHREGDFFNYNLDVDVYSMSYQSPAQRVKAIMEIVTGVFPPLLPLLMEQGGTIDVQRTVEILSELLDIPRLKEIIKFEGTTPEELQAEQARGPTNTTRTYERRNIPTGGTDQGRRHVRQQAWLSKAGAGGQVNPDQAASLALPA